MAKKPYKTVRALALRALENGGIKTSAISVSWELEGSCTDPYFLSVMGRNDLNAPLWVDMSMRCRKCPECLRQRGWSWKTRAEEETRLASRTWFGTFTLRPEEHLRSLHQAREVARSRGVDFDALDADEQFRARSREIARDFTLFFKRVRKTSDARFRYLLVAEPHKSGLPHYHALIHEIHPLKPIRHKVLKGAWKLGFSAFKLTDLKDQKEGYVCKYISKSLLARVRASKRYGITPLGAAEGVPFDPQKTCLVGVNDQATGFIGTEQ